MAKYLAAKASWGARQCLPSSSTVASASCLQVRRGAQVPPETRLHQVAPISTNLICSLLGRKHLLGLPRSF